MGCASRNSSSSDLPLSHVRQQDVASIPVSGQVVPRMRVGMNGKCATGRITKLAKLK